MQICEVAHFIYFLSAVHLPQLFHPVGTSVVHRVSSLGPYSEVQSYSLKGVTCDSSR